MKLFYYFAAVCLLDHNHGVEPKIISYMDNLLELIGSQCRFCPIQYKTSTRIVGCTLVVNMTCDAGHTFSWASSPSLMNSVNSTIYKANLGFASAMLLSGNNFYKIL